MRLMVAGAILLAAGGAIALATARAASPDTPTMFRGGPDHSGRYRVRPVTHFAGLRWRVQTGGMVQSSVTVADGAAYVGSGDGTLYAFDAGIYTDPESIRDGLYRQLFNPVRWSAIVAAMIKEGATAIVECGPGKVLVGLARRAPGGRDLALHAIESPETLVAVRAAVGGPA